MRRALRGALAAIFAATLGAGAIWGCATREPVPQPADPRNARNYEPDGGWANYRPTGNDVARVRDVGPNTTLNAGPIVPGTPNISPSNVSPATAH